MMTIYGYSHCISDAHCHPEQSRTASPDVSQHLAQKEVHLSRKCQPFGGCCPVASADKGSVSAPVCVCVCESRSKFGDGGGNVLQGGSSLGGGESLDGLQSLVAMVTA